MKEIDLFDDSPEEKTMTVIEIAEVLNVSERLIRKRIKELWHDRSADLKHNSQGGYILTEPQVTELKLRIQENSSLTTYDDRHRLSSMPKTDLEKKLLIKQGYDLLMEEIEVLKPKAEKYDAFISAAGTMDMKEVSDVLNIENVGRNNLMRILRAQGVLSERNKPYQNLIRLGYFKEVPVETHVGIKCKPVAFTRGVSFIKKAVDNFFEEGGEL